MLPADALFRFALIAAWDNKCAICGEMLRLRDMEVDHVIPQHLAGKPQALKEELDRFGLDQTFDIFGYANQVPTHSSCNLAKRGKIQTEQFGRWMLEQAARKVARVRTEQAKLEKEFEAERAHMIVSGALERGTLSREILLHALAEPVGGPEPGSYANPIVGLYSVSIEDVLRESGETRASVDLADLYNDLEVNLCEYLEGAPTHLIMYTEETARNGETMAARVACWETSPDAIREALDGSWWKIIGIYSFYQVYGRYFGSEEK